MTALQIIVIIFGILAIMALVVVFGPVVGS